MKKQISFFVVGLGLFFAPHRSQAFDLFGALDGTQSFKTIKGNYEKYEDLGEGTFCRKAQKYSFDWNVEIERADALFNDQGGITVDLALGASTVKVAGHRKGGLLCSWMGAQGSLAMDRMTGQFRIHSVEGNDHPAVDIVDMKLGRFAMGQVTLFIPGGATWTATPPEWMNDLLTKTLHKGLQVIMQTEIKKNLESIIGKKLKDFIEGDQAPLTDILIQ
jgi:hypothetical protein